MTSGLADEFPGRDPLPDVGVRQGVVRSWNGFTYENTIDVGGALIKDVPCVNTIEAFGISVGDTVFLLRTRTSYCIVGRAIDPSQFDLRKCIGIIRDFRGNVLVMPDIGDESVGLARPWLGIPMHRSVLAANESTTSATFETLWKGVMYKQHACLYAQFAVNTGAGVTGEVRLISNGVQVGSTVSIAAGTFLGHEIGPSPVEGFHEQFLTVELQARRTAGATAVQVWLGGVIARMA